MYIVEVFSIKTRTWRIVYTSTHKDSAEQAWHRISNNGMTPRLRKVPR